MLQFDLEKPDHLEGQAGRPGDGHPRVGVGREHLADLAMGHQVAFGGLPVAGHDHAVLVPKRQHRGADRCRNRPNIGWNLQTPRVTEGQQQITEAGTWCRDVE
jgi:hypothetical protein